MSPLWTTSFDFAAEVRRLRSPLCGTSQNAQPSAPRYAGLRRTKTNPSGAGLRKLK